METSAFIWLLFSILLVLVLVYLIQTMMEVHKKPIKTHTTTYNIPFHLKIPISLTQPLIPFNLRTKRCILPWSTTNIDHICLDVAWYVSRTINCKNLIVKEIHYYQSEDIKYENKIQIPFSAHAWLLQPINHAVIVNEEKLQPPFCLTTSNQKSITVKGKQWFLYFFEVLSVFQC